MNLAIVVIGLVGLAAGTVSARDPHGLRRRIRPASWRNATARQRHRNAQLLERGGYVAIGAGLTALVLELLL